MDAATGIDPRHGGRSGTERARQLACRQFDTIARRQLLSLGFGERRIESWLSRELLHRRYPGVYAWGRPDLTLAGQMAAGLLYGGPGTALAGLTALWWRGLLNRRPAAIHIDAPGGSSSRGDLRIRHTRSIERVTHRNLPVVPLPRSLLTASDVLSQNALRLVLARAEFDGQLDLPSLQIVLGDGRSGTRAVRAATNAHLPQLARCVNGFERTFVLLCESHALPIPEPNPRIGRHRPDMLWREARLIVELDGRGAHHTPAQLAADAARQAALEARGYTVIRCTWWEVHRDGDRVAATVRRHLRRPPKRPPDPATATAGSPRPR